MRVNVSKQKLNDFMEQLGNQVESEGVCYLTGGSSAVLEGWRDMTIDIDIKFDPEPTKAFDIIPQLKESLQLNIELAAPDQFIPEVDGWKSRSKFIKQAGKIKFFHYDFVAQALSKLERGHTQDLKDVTEMLKRKLITKQNLLDALQNISGKLSRYPAIDAKSYIENVKKFLTNE